MFEATIQRPAPRHPPGPRSPERQGTERLERTLREHVRHPERINRRLARLDREWNAERVMMVKAATLTLLGAALATRDRRWLSLPATVGVFLLQQAVQGWNPLSAIVRRAGLRSAAEIRRERAVLMALRGDPGGFGNGRGRKETSAKG